MKKTFTASCFFVATFLCSFGQTTDSLMGPRVWLNAERSELTANLWSDLSIYKNDATAGFPGNIPSSSTLINFNKSLVFDGVDDYLKIPFSLDGLAELSILAVVHSRRYDRTRYLGIGRVTAESASDNQTGNWP